jgi:hypothetical protein
MALGTSILIEGLQIALILALLVLVYAGILWVRLAGEKFEVEQNGVLPDNEAVVELDDIRGHIRAVTRVITRHRGALPPPIDVIKLDASGEAELLRHYGIPSDVVVTRRYEPLAVPAHISGDGSRYVITVDPKYRFDVRVLRAVLAHEVAHIWVDCHLKSYDSTLALERCVDVAAVLLGCGSLILAGAAQKAAISSGPQGLGIGIETTKFGYLTLSEFAMVYLCYAKIRGIQPKALHVDLPPVSRKALKQASRLIRRTPLVEAIGAKCSCRCCNCFQRFTVPNIPRRTISLKCPLCKQPFEFRGSGFLRRPRFSRAILRD